MQCVSFGCLRLSFGCLAVFQPAAEFWAGVVQPGLVCIDNAMRVLRLSARRTSSKASDSGPPRARVGWFSLTALRELEVQPNGYRRRSLFLALLRDCRLFRVAGVQDHREEAGPGLVTRIPARPMH